MGKKGVSADEKRARLLAMFHTSRAVYTKKEVERDGAKLGILSQAVEGVLKDLCGDDLVKEAKVGISTYYWAFPGELGTAKTNALNIANEHLARLEDRHVELGRVRHCDSSAQDGGQRGRARHAVLMDFIETISVFVHRVTYCVRAAPERIVENFDIFGCKR